VFVVVSTGRSSDDVQRIRRWFWITVEKMNNIDKQDLVRDMSLFAGRWSCVQVFAGVCEWFTGVLLMYVHVQV
jgi:hypothetical protein